MYRWQVHVGHSKRKHYKRAHRCLRMNLQASDIVTPLLIRHLQKSIVFSRPTSSSVHTHLRHRGEAAPIHLHCNVAYWITTTQRDTQTAHDNTQRMSQKKLVIPWQPSLCAVSFMCVTNRATALLQDFSGGITWFVAVVSSKGGPELSEGEFFDPEATSFCPKYSAEDSAHHHTGSVGEALCWRYTKERWYSL